VTMAHQLENVLRMSSGLYHGRPPHAAPVGQARARGRAIPAKTMPGLGGSVFAEKRSTRPVNVRSTWVAGRSRERLDT